MRIALLAQVPPSRRSVGRPERRRRARRRWSDERCGTVLRHRGTGGTTVPGWMWTIRGLNDRRYARTLGTTVNRYNSIIALFLMTLISQGTSAGASVPIASIGNPQGSGSPFAPTKVLNSKFEASGWMPSAQVSPRNSPLGPSALAAPTPRPALELVSHFGGATQAVAVGGGYAYFAVGPRIAILAAPVGQDARLIAWTAPLVGRATALAIQGQYLYVFGIGLHIFDVSNPAYPAEVGSIVARGTRLIVDGNYAYLAGLEDGLIIVDISDSRAPRLVSKVKTPPFAYDVALHGDIAYVVCGASGVVAVDVTQRDAPRIRSTFVGRPGFRVAVFGETLVQIANQFVA